MSTRSYSVMATVAPKADLRQTQQSQHYLGDDPMRAVSELMSALTNYSEDDSTMTVSVCINVSDPAIPTDPEPEPEDPAA